MSTTLLIIVATICSTITMTTFSYLLSYFIKKQYREPELLNLLICKSKFIPIEASKNHPLGWIIHFSIGLVFDAVLILLWSNYSLSSSWQSGVYLGIVLGIIGSIGWTLFFKTIYKPSHIDFWYFVHLIIAHIIFVLTALALYKIN
ncbi:hypothetical protein [Leeuwenhoekiella sp. LLG6367-2.1]|uniref:hypothetical protein n=1 Tax=Leeuwenhoekiella sp. LLG6367-2.1 TaxID=3160833 RepID=UPI0038636DED